MKKLLIALGAVVVLIILLVVVAILTVRPDELINAHKDEVAKTVSQTLGREVRLGKVESFFWPSFGAVIRDVALAGPAGAKKDQLSLGEVEVRVALLRAVLSFGKTLEVEQLVLRGLDVRVARDKEGRWDFQDILDHLAAGAPPPEGEEAAPPPKDLTFLEGATVSRVALERASISIDDATLGRPLQVAELGFELRDIRLGAPIHIKLHALLQDGNNRSPIDLEATLSELRKDLSFDPVPDLNAALRLADLDLGPWGGLLPAGALAPAQGKVAIDVKTEASAGLTQLVTKGTVKVDKLVLRQGAKRGQPLSLDVAIDASLNSAQPRYRIDRINVSGTGVTIDGKVDAYGLTPAGLKNADLKLAVQDLARLLAVVPAGSPLLPEELGLEGPIKAHVNGNAQTVDLLVDLDAAHVRWAELFDKKAGRALNLKLKGNQKGERLEIPSFTLAVDSAKIAGSLSLGTKAGAPMEADLKTGQVQLASLRELLPPISEALKKGDKVAGSFSLSAQAKVVGDKQEAKAQVALAGLDVNLASLSARGGGAIDASVVPSGESTALAVTADLDRLALSSAGEGGDKVLDKPAGMPLRLDLKVVQGAARADVKKAELRLGGTQIAATGGATGLDSGSPALDLDFGQLNVAFDDLRRTLPGAGALPAGGHLKGQLKVKGRPDDLSTLAADAKIAELLYDQARIDGTLRVENLDRPRFAFDIKSPYLNIDQLLGEDEGDDKGDKKKKADKAGADDNPHGLSSSTREQLAKVNGEGNLKVGKAIFKGMELSNFVGKLKMVDGVVTFDALDFDIYKGHVSAAGSRFDLPAEYTGYTLKMKTSNIDLGMAMAQHTSVGHLFTGSANNDIDVSGRGLSKEDLSASLSGPVSIKGDPLGLKSLDVLGPIGKPVASTLSKAGVKKFKGFGEEGGTILRSVEAFLRFNKGQYTLKQPLRSRTGFGVLVLAGGGALDNTIDFTGTALLSPQTVNKAMGTKAVDKPVPVPLKIGGTWAEPKVTGVDVEALVKALLGGQAGAVIDEAKEQVDKAKAEAEARARAAADKAKAEAAAAKKRAEDEARKQADAAKREAEKKKKEAEEAAKKAAEKKKKEAEEAAKKAAEKKKKEAEKKAKKMFGL